MRLDDVAASIKRVLRKHSQVLQQLSEKQSSLLELAAVCAFVEHYRANGSQANLLNPEGKKQCDDSVAAQMRQAFDVLWQAAGHSGSINFDQDRKWVPKR